MIRVHQLRRGRIKSHNRKGKPTICDSFQQKWGNKISCILRSDGKRKDSDDDFEKSPPQQKEKRFMQQIKISVIQKC